MSIPARALFGPFASVLASTSLLFGCGAQHLELTGIDSSAAEVGGEAPEEELALVDQPLTAGELSALERLDAEECAFFGLINQYRASNGRAPLTGVSLTLSKAASFHSQDMAAKNYFNHTLQDGTTWSQNMTNMGYTFNTYRGENIAAANATAARTFEQWRNSPGHNANMLHTEYKAIGIGRAYGASSTYGWYWTTDFGGYVDATFDLTTACASTPAPGVDAGTAPVPSSNLLQHSGFESGSFAVTGSYLNVRTLGAWHRDTDSAGSSAEMREGSRYAGSFGLRLVDPLEGNVTLTQVVPAVAGRTYDFAAWARKVSGSTAQMVMIDFLDSSFARLSRASTQKPSSTAWTRITRSSVAPAGTRYARVVFYAYASSGYASTYDWDDLSLRAR